MKRINIRKKQKQKIETLNRKFLAFLISTTIILCGCLCFYINFLCTNITKKNFENDSINLYNSISYAPFSINKIVLYSSVTADSSTINQSLLNLNISQYCDIGIYLNKINDKSFAIKSLNINNINVSKTEYGTPCIYSKNLSDFGKCTFLDENKIYDYLNYSIINTSYDINYENNELYDNASSPIYFGFYNKNIKENFVIEASDVIYDATLLKQAIIPLSSINCSLSFSINITTTNDKKYVSNVTIDIPLESNDEKIYNIGYIQKEINCKDQFNFICIK